METHLGARELKQLSFSIDLILAAALVLLIFYGCQLLVAALATADVFQPTAQFDEEAVASSPQAKALP